MDVHKNARSLPASRALLYQRVRVLGVPLREAAEAIGISVRRARTWIRRAEQGEPMLDRSSRPHRIQRTPQELEDRVLALRRERMTLRAIAHATGVSFANVGRICRRHCLNRLSSLEPPAPPRRYERERPGELLHLDIKKLGRFEAAGHRVTGDRSKVSKHVGWESLHVATDDASRVSYAELLPDERRETTVGFFERAVAWFADHGVTVTGVMTDNGPAYKSLMFAAACRRLGIRHLRTRPYTPRTNGKVERMIQTLLREWAYRFSYGSSAERRTWLDPFLHFYNAHRAHSALGYNPPFSRLDRNNVLKLNS
jgi:transposase InsO family protein